MQKGTNFFELSNDECLKRECLYNEQKITLQAIDWRDENNISLHSYPWTSFFYLQILQAPRVKTKGS